VQVKKIARGYVGLHEPLEGVKDAEGGI